MYLDEWFGHRTLLHRDIGHKRWESHVISGKDDYYWVDLSEVTACRYCIYQSTLNACMLENPINKVYMYFVLVVLYLIVFWLLIKVVSWTFYFLCPYMNVYVVHTSLFKCFINKLSLRIYIWKKLVLSPKCFQHSPSFIGISLSISLLIKYLMICLLSKECVCVCVRVYSWADKIKHGKVHPLVSCCVWFCVSNLDTWRQIYWFLAER